ncbi:MAG: SoxR reducing system RseC family protein [Gammaproteobacteria bacterium]|nr:SoxR reducing system RseC family protein [Gammaproteobacteria bacterium]MYF38396.1 SoxR reducing system RseC family protein [Gammaproteobacteria bacterium]
MIEAIGTVVATQGGSSVIRFAYSKCNGCNSRCNRTKKNEFRHSEALTLGTDVVLKVPASGIFFAVFLTLGIPLLVFFLGFAFTGSVILACGTMVLVLLANIVLFRYFPISDVLLRPTICRIN